MSNTTNTQQTRSRNRPHLQVKKTKLPSPNRNQSKLSKSQQQTVYCSSQDEQNIMTSNLHKTISKWSQTNLQVSYKPDNIIGRQKQKQKVTEFIDGCLLKEITNRCLCTYLSLLFKDISGCPGLGKTVTVMQMIESISKGINKQKAAFHYINSLTLKQPAAIYKQLLLKSKQKIQSQRKQPFSLAIEFDTYIKSAKLKTQLFFVIDQVDFLYTKNQNVLYNLVQWCSLPQCKFAIIMIANTMDFPQKLAPKITSRMGSWRMCFKPYSSQQIKKIIQKRLQGSDYFQPKAIQFAVKKFSVYTSDLRKIFNILKQVIASHQSKNTKKRVTIQQVSSVWSKLVQQQDISYKQQLPQIYFTILDLIKRQGGKMHSYHMMDYLYQKGIKSQQIEMLLNDMKDMGMVKILQKEYKSVKGLLATLINDGDY